MNSQLVKGSIKTIVVLPKYVDVSEWLALNGNLLLFVWILSNLVLQNLSSFSILISFMVSSLKFVPTETVRGGPPFSWLIFSMSAGPGYVPLHIVPVIS